MPPNPDHWSDDEDGYTMHYGVRTPNQPRGTWNHLNWTNPPAELDNESISSGEVQDIPHRRQVISSSRSNQPTIGRSSGTTSAAAHANSLTMADHRFERNYTDRGHRQTVSPNGLSREEAPRRRSRSPPRIGGPLFFPDEEIDESIFDLGPPRFRTEGTIFHRNLYDTSRTIDVNPYDSPYVDVSELNARDNDNPYVDASQVNTSDNHLYNRLNATDYNQEEDADTECTCPISYHCIHRAVDKLDCRPLVPEWKAFCDTLDEESYKIDKIVGAQPNGNPITSSRLSDINQYCNRIEKLPGTSRIARENTYREMRRWIQEVRESSITTDILQSSQILPRLEQFLHNSNEPIRKAKGVSPWVEEELTILLKKFRRGDLSFNPERGLIRSQNMDVNNTAVKTTLKIDKSWEHYCSPKAYGNNGLVNGQLWYSREQLLRDGAHGARIGGIAGTTSGGAYSVVMGLHTKENKYADIDQGDFVDYEGTALPAENSKPSNERDSDEDVGTHKTKGPTRGTKTLMRSLETGKPIRMFRSFKLAKIVKHRPVRGYRYDGLYKVTKQKLQNKNRQIYSFTMVREPGQGPIRDTHLSQCNGNAPAADQERPGWASSVKKAGDKRRNSSSKDLADKSNNKRKKK